MRTRFIPILIGLLLLNWAAALPTSHLEIRDVTRNKKQELIIYSDIKMSEEQAAALKNGIPLTFNYEIKIMEQGRWGFRSLYDERKLPYTLKYHGLSKQYVVRDEHNQQQKSYPTLTLALAQIEQIKIEGFGEDLYHHYDARHGRVGGLYQGRARLRLDIEALPAPLRIPAYLSSQWRLNSDWFVFNWREEL